MQHFLLGCLIGAALCAAVAVPLLLPWPARVRYLVNANTIDPLLGFGPAPRVSMRVVVVDAVDACGGRLELVLGDGMTERRSHFEVPGCVPARVAILDGWSALRTPLLLMADEEGRQHLYGPSGAVTDLVVKPVEVG